MTKLVKTLSVIALVSLLSACQTPLSECIQENSRYVPITEYDYKTKKEKVVSHHFDNDMTSSILCTFKKPTKKK